MKVIMTKQVDPKLVVKHLVNGTLGENLCRICLLPLGNLYENIFTKVCKENEEYCIADILRELCNVKILDNDHYNVCSECYVAASNSFNFYFTTRRTEEILNSYTDSLVYNLDSIEMPENVSNESLFFSLPLISPDIPIIDFDPNKLSVKNCKEEYLDVEIKQEKKLIEIEIESKAVKKEQVDEEDLVIIMNERGEPSFFKMQANGQLLEYEYDDRCRKAYKVITEDLPRRIRKKKRKPMAWKKCSRCPVVYRFVAKMKEHMWLTHGVTLNTCKICKALVEGEEEFQFHMDTHTNEYQCEICNIVFKRRATIIMHLALHDKIKDTHQNYVCKDCGKILKDEESLNTHMEEHNLKDYTCYYCGRMYKKEIGFNNHIQKHEMYMKGNEIKNKQGEKRTADHPLQEKQVKEFTCELCGRSFLGQRALLWHSRLHTNERPFTCKVCGRGFVSLNRCNQHALCAHTAPSRRCPLCPALFHMRSMVNSHIKKVHLQAHKRRNRTVRHKDVFWHTEPVPIEELSVAIQSDILELQAARQDAANNVVLFAD